MEYSIVTVNVNILYYEYNKYINCITIGGFDMKVSITNGRINGLNGKKFYCCRNCYQWIITFTESSGGSFCSSLNIYLGDYEKEAEKALNLFKKKFENVEIYDKDEVSILYDEGGSVHAVGKLKKDIWLDMDDQFFVKPFSKLNIFQR